MSKELSVQGCGGGATQLYVISLKSETMGRSIDREAYIEFGWRGVGWYATELDHRGSCFLHRTEQILNRLACSTAILRNVVKVDAVHNCTHLLKTTRAKTDEI
jgi:hypothetical protein